jgi:hypothetical protein
MMTPRTTRGMASPTTQQLMYKDEHSSAEWPKPASPAPQQSKMRRAILVALILLTTASLMYIMAPTDLPHPRTLTITSPSAYWRDHFSDASLYHVARTEHFPEPYRPEVEKHGDAGGFSLRILGKYKGDPDKPGITDVNSPHYYSLNYQLCSFENVCLNAKDPQHLWFHFRNLTTYLHYSHVFSRCAGGKYESVRGDASNPVDPLCTCFHLFFRPMMREYEWEMPKGQEEEWKQEMTLPKLMDAEVRKRIDSIPPSIQLPSSTAQRRYPDLLAYVYAPEHHRDHSHYWGVNKWVASHHIAHWTQKLMIAQSLWQHSQTFYAPTIEAYQKTGGTLSPQAHPHLPPLTGLVFQDSDSHLSNHESTQMMISLASAFGPRSKTYVRSVMMNERKNVRTQQRMMSRRDEGRGKGERTSTSFSTADSSSKPHAALRWSEPELWHDDRSGIIWQEDLRANKYSTSRPPLKAGSPVSVEPDPTKANHPSASDLPLSHSDFTCFKRLSWTPHYGEVSYHPKDTDRWRAMMHGHYAEMSAVENTERRKKSAPGAPATAVAPLPAYHTPVRDYALDAPASCPPRRITLLFRTNRHILNYASVMELLARKFKLEWVDPKPQLVPTEGKPLDYSKFRFHSALEYAPQLQFVTIDETSTTLDQYRLFTSTGLMLSSHSSQLMNVLFTHPSAGLIEITPWFWNNDFVRYAVGVGVTNYRYLMGGMTFSADAAINGSPAVQPESSPAAEKCVEELNKRCQGRGPCILWENYAVDCRSHSNHNKNLNFHLDSLSALEKIVDEAVEEIERKCEGEWIAGFEKEREKEK